jgi:hypothetical protein
MPSSQPALPCTPWHFSYTVFLQSLSLRLNWRRGQYIPVVGVITRLCTIQTVLESAILSAYLSTKIGRMFLRIRRLWWEHLRPHARHWLRAHFRPLSMAWCFRWRHGVSREVGTRDDCRLVGCRKQMNVGYIFILLAISLTMERM